MQLIQVAVEVALNIVRQTLREKLTFFLSKVIFMSHTEEKCFHAIFDVKLF